MYLGIKSSRRPMRVQPKNSVFFSTIQETIADSHWPGGGMASSCYRAAAPPRVQNLTALFCFLKDQLESLHPSVLWIMGSSSFSGEAASGEISESTSLTTLSGTSNSRNLLFTQPPARPWLCCIGSFVYLSDVFLTVSSWEKRLCSFSAFPSYSSL